MLQHCGNGLKVFDIRKSKLCLETGDLGICLLKMVYPTTDRVTNNKIRTILIIVIMKETKEAHLICGVHFIKIRERRKMSKFSIVKYDKKEKEKFMHKTFQFKNYIVL